MQAWIISPPQLVMTKRPTLQPSNQIWQWTQQIWANLYAFKLESLLSSPWKFIRTFKFNGYWNLVISQKFGVLFPALSGKGEALLIGAEGKSGSQNFWALFPASGGEDGIHHCSDGSYLEKGARQGNVGNLKHPVIKMSIIQHTTAPQDPNTFPYFPAGSSLLLLSFFSWQLHFYLTIYFPFLAFLTLLKQSVQTNIHFQHRSSGNFWEGYIKIP